MQRDWFGSKAVTLGLVVSIAGCGGTTRESGSDTSFASGVPSNQQLDQLSEEEAEQLCTTALDYTQRSGADDFELARAMCTFTAASLSSPESCEEVAAGCIAEVETALEQRGDTCELPGYETCEATVAEYESCTSAVPDFSRRLLEMFNSVGCDQAPHTASPAELEQLQAVPPACERLQAQCPAIFGLADPEADATLCERHCDDVLEPACPTTADRDGCLLVCGVELDRADQQGCGTEQRALFECMAALEPNPYYCTSSGGLAHLADVCEAEELAYRECTPE